MYIIYIISLHKQYLTDVKLEGIKQTACFLYLLIITQIKAYHQTDRKIFFSLQFLHALEEIN